MDVQKPLLPVHGTAGPLSHNVEQEAGKDPDSDYLVEVIPSVFVLPQQPAVAAYLVAVAAEAILLVFALVLRFPHLGPAVAASSVVEVVIPHS
ncbi:MAG: hypothetical protein JSV09_14140 [Thermoplasmata archaeon]|nr:MAG: hypothetical protein JSV09_14140 [Thermoplasmata archaeon]